MVSRRRSARGVPSARTADRESHLPILVELLPASLRSFREARTGRKAYLRYVDDFALFSNSKHELWRCKLAIMERLAALRLTIHERSAQAPILFA